MLRTLCEGIPWRCLSGARLLHSRTLPRSDSKKLTICCNQLPRRSGAMSIHSRSLHSSIQISEEVKAALNSNQPVVALESTIITHGMPYPQNIRTALMVESTVRRSGAIPATIAILAGKIHVGLGQEELEALGQMTEVIKTSRRDLAYVISNSLSGGTTVSGTMIAAHMAGIPIFVTGGIGGVHRGAETSMDISADLRELGRLPIAVVSAGVKSILDIEKTLEYLETEGVCVASYGPSKDFPSFFTSNSGYEAPCNVETPQQAAHLIATSLSLGLDSGLLIGVPIPTGDSEAGDMIDEAIQQAVKEAEYQGIKGKDVTPFLLERMNHLTDGKSLEANMLLMRNNAKVGSEIAVELAKIHEHTPDKRGQTFVTGSPRMPPPQVAPQPKSDTPTHRMTAVDAQSFKKAAPVVQKEAKRVPSATLNVKSRPVVIGGTNVDFTAVFNHDEVKPNGATYPGQVRASYGGVGRNIADCLTRLGTTPVFLSAIGKDTYSDMLLQQCKHMDFSAVSQEESHSTATYCAVLESSGQLLYGIGDFDVHSCVSTVYVSEHEEKLASAPIVVMDGNIPDDVMDYITKVCKTHKVPVWFEPTDYHNVEKPFLSGAWKRLTYTSPNLNELRAIHAHTNGHPVTNTDKNSESGSSQEDVIEEAVSLAREVVEHIPVVLVTLGQYGVLLCSNTDARSLPTKEKPITEVGDFRAVHYPAVGPGQVAPPVVSVSGTGDCLAAAVISGIIKGLPTETCIKAGLLAATFSIISHHAVPESITSTIVTSQGIHKWAPWKPTVIQG